MEEVLLAVIGLLLIWLVVKYSSKSKKHINSEQKIEIILDTKCILDAYGRYRDEQFDKILHGTYTYGTPINDNSAYNEYNAKKYYQSIYNYRDSNWVAL